MLSLNSISPFTLTLKPDSYSFTIFPIKTTSKGLPCWNKVLLKVSLKLP